jgi:Rps23 Pro-64 3,4-dihydroxylase Tpa1-like proline 4-hydroxylase
MDNFLKNISEFSFQNSISDWVDSKPFSHLVIDDFLIENFAAEVAQEFPLYDDPSWKIYNNPLEIKKLQNHWDKFGINTYRLLSYLNSREFISKLECLTNCELFADIGLNGGGLHSHKKGGKLNTHLDYSIHPKLGLERRLNLILYITPDWREEWGGSLGLWSSDEAGNIDKLIKSIWPKFNRAVLFDTSQNSWHGLPAPIECPEGTTRNSIAVYYLCVPRETASKRGKALFTPYEEQKIDPEILELIKARSESLTANKVYGDK